MISLLDPQHSGRHTVVGVTGEIDVASAPVLRDTLLAQLNRGVESLVVDLRGVTFIDSTGVGSLLWMIGLTAVMVAEKTAPWGHRLVRPVAVVLVAAGAWVSLPAFLS